MTINQFAQNLVWASPAGATGAPSMRGLVANDLPTAHNPITISDNIATPLLELNANAAPMSGFVAPPADTVLWLAGEDGSQSRMTLDAFGSLPNLTFRASGGTGAAPTALASGAYLGSFGGFGATGAGTYTAGAAAGINFQTSQAWTPTATGTLINFSTTANGAAASRTVAYFDQDGGLKPFVDNTYTLGTSALRWSSVNAATLVITNAANPLLEITDGTHNGYVGKVTSAGSFFTDAVAGDFILRSNEGSIRMGVSNGSNSTMQINSTGGVAFEDTNTNTVTNFSVTALNNVNGVNFTFVGNGSTTPSKVIRVVNGVMQWVNSAYTAVILSLDDTGDLTLSGLLVTKSYTYTTLPAASAAGAGARAFVTDSTVAASGNFGATLAGSGTNKVPVYSDGTNWRIG